MQLRVRRRIERRLEERAEDVVDEVLEVADDALVAVDVVEPRDLDEPDDCFGCFFGVERVGEKREMEGEKKTRGRKSELEKSFSAKKMMQKKTEKEKNSSSSPLSFFFSGASSFSAASAATRAATTATKETTLGSVSAAAASFPEARREAPSRRERGGAVP